MLKVENLSYRIDQTSLIKDINLSFLPGNLYCIIGPNGSGKSTLLKTIMGIWKPTTGNITWKNQKLSDLPRRQLCQILSYVPQVPFVPFEYSVLEMVQMGRYTYKAPHNEERVEWGLKIVDAWNLKDRSMVKLSQGEKQRVYIARALVTESPILLLDEPTANLDIRHQLDIWELLGKLVKQGKTIITATHDLAAAKAHSDSVIILNHGKCKNVGPFAQAMSKELFQEVFDVDPEIASILQPTYQYR